MSDGLDNAGYDGGRQLSPVHLGWFRSRLWIKNSPSLWFQAMPKTLARCPRCVFRAAGEPLQGFPIETEALVVTGD